MGVELRYQRWYFPAIFLWSAPSNKVNKLYFDLNKFYKRFVKLIFTLFCSVIASVIGGILKKIQITSLKADYNS